MNQFTDLLTYCLNFCLTNSKLVLTALVVILYLVYYNYCAFFEIVVKKVGGDARRKRGKCPPSFPNGWFRLCNTKDLKKGDTKFFKYNGRHVVLFRGMDGVPYCMDAYCAHMGANLSTNGVVKHETCIQCSFHGWLFDGRTGKIVTGEERQPKKIVQFEYNNGIEDPRIDSKGELLKSCHEGEFSQLTYHVVEQNHQILVWFHSSQYENKEQKPLWEAMKVNEPLAFRGEATQFINAHVQETPENGADIRHFPYIHKNSFGSNLVRFKWGMKSMPANNENLNTYMTHKHKGCNDHKMYLFKKYLTDKNKKYINILDLDCSISFLWLPYVFCFNATGFQVGPGQVFLHLSFRNVFNVIIQQNIVPTDKFMQKITNYIYCSSWLPYFVSALFLFGEVDQINRDIVVWDQKIFGEKLCYNMNAESDQILKRWRTWYGQFYEGGMKFEKTMEELQW